MKFQAPVDEMWAKTVERLSVPYFAFQMVVLTRDNTGINSFDDLKGKALGNNVGLYSKKYKSFDDLPTGATVAIANDPINSGRGLQLLAKAGLITLKPGAGYKATEEDITDNPKKLKILQVEAVQLVRAYDDADLVQGYPAYIRLAKTFDATSAILFDGIDHPEYVIQFVIQPKSKDDPRLAKFIDIYQHSPVVKASLDKTYGTLYQPGWKN